VSIVVCLVTDLRERSHGRGTTRRGWERLRFPSSHTLGDGIFKLRVGLDRVARRITFYFADDRRIVLSTTFRKQRQNEWAEVRRGEGQPPSERPWPSL